MSQIIQQMLRIGTTIEWKGPFGEFQYTPNKYQELVMLACGTGIAPMIQIIRHVLNNENDFTRLKLLYASRHQGDILMKTVLNEFRDYWNFNVTYYLSQSSPDSLMEDKGYICYGDKVVFGRIELSELKLELTSQGKGDTLSDRYFLVCGTKSFDKDMIKYLFKMNYNFEDIFKFYLSLMYKQQHSIISIATHTQPHPFYEPRLYIFLQKQASWKMSPHSFFVFLFLLVAICSPSLSISVSINGTQEQYDTEEQPDSQFIDLPHPKIPDFMNETRNKLFHALYNLSGYLPFSVEYAVTVGRNCNIIDNNSHYYGVPGLVISAIIFVIGVLFCFIGKTALLLYAQTVRPISDLIVHIMYCMIVQRRILRNIYISKKIMNLATILI